MKSNPILEEIWQIKDELGRQANHDIHQLCDNTRRWAANHPHKGPRIRNADELRQWMADRQRQSSDIVVREDRPSSSSSDS
jgi:hypothetical protein